MELCILSGVYRHGYLWSLQSSIVYFILCEENSGVYGVIYDEVFMELFICTLEWTQWNILVQLFLCITEFLCEELLMV